MTDSQTEKIEETLDDTVKQRSFFDQKSSNSSIPGCGNDCKEPQNYACDIKLSGSVLCCESDKDTIFSWNLLIENCQPEPLSKVSLLLDVRAFFTTLPFQPGPGVFEQAVWSVASESLSVIVDPAYHGTGVFATLKSLPMGRIAFTLYATFSRKMRNLCEMKMLPGVFTLQATLGRGNQNRSITVADFVSTCCNCATCDETTDLVYCDFATTDNLQRGANMAFNGEFEKGIVYTFTSWLIDGVEMLLQPVMYTILNINQNADLASGTHSAVVLGQDTEIGSTFYLANFGAAFGHLFSQKSLEEEWKAILNPDFFSFQSVDVLRIVFPSQVKDWKIQLTRHDGLRYVYQKDASGIGYVTGIDNEWDSRNTEAYQYCNSMPQPISLSPMLLKECLYVDWDRTEISNLQNVLQGDGSIEWQVLDFNINGISPGSTFPYSYKINNVNQLTRNTASDTFANNNAVFLNQYFSSIGLSANWKAKAVGDNQFLLLYPNTAYAWFMVVKRNNGNVYFYTHKGIVTSENQFNSIDSNYANICSDRQLGYVFPANSTVPFRKPPKEDSSREGSPVRRLAKDATPLSVPVPTQSSEITGLLYERCAIVYEYLRSHLLEPQRNGFRLFLFGSQVRGISSSGRPDIDMWFVCDSLRKSESKPLLDALMSQQSFKLDITHVATSVLNDRVQWIEFLARS